MHIVWHFFAKKPTVLTKKASRRAFIFCFRNDCLSVSYDTSLSGISYYSLFHFQHILLRFIKNTMLRVDQIQNGKNRLLQLSAPGVVIQGDKIYSALSHHVAGSFLTYAVNSNGMSAIHLYQFHTGNIRVSISNVYHIPERNPSVFLRCEVV